MPKSVAAKQTVGVLNSHRFPTRQHFRRGLLHGVSALAFAMAVAPAMAINVNSDVVVGDPGYAASNFNSGIAYIGASANGSVTLNNSAQNVSQTSTFSTFIGNNTNSGNLTITGAGTSWTTNNVMRVGYTGDGKLNILNGGSLSTKGASFAQPAGSNVEVVVSGVGSKLLSSTTGSFILGFSGEATLTISDGGLVYSNLGIAVAYQATSKGTVTVTGTGSKLQLRDIHGANLATTEGATGTLTIADGGTVESLTGGNIYALSVGGNGSNNTNATLNIGNDATKNAGTLRTNEIKFGTAAGEGTRVINFKHNESDYILSSFITGNGTLNHYAGTTSLTGDNKNFRAEVSVLGGTLKVKGVCRIGAASNIKIDKGAVFAFELTGSDYTHDGMLDGEGTFTYDSPNITTSLNAMSTNFSGVTNLNNGTLKLLNTDALGSSQVEMGLGTTLNIESVTPGKLANAISGAGTIIHSGSFATTLTGKSSKFTGQTNVTHGALIIGDAKSTTAELKGSVNVDLGAKLSGTGKLSGSAVVSGQLLGTVGETFTVETLILQPSATVSITIPDNSTKLTPAAFKGTFVDYGKAAVTDIIMPDGYSISGPSAEFHLFDYMLRSGTITIAPSASLPYASSNFTFTGIENGYLVLASKSGPTPPTPTTWNGDYPALQSPSVWSGVTHTFVDGKSWTDGSTFFIGDAANKPVQVEGFVRIAGLAVNGTNYVFKDAGNSAAPGVFSLMPASGSSAVELSVQNYATATIAIPIGGGNFIKTGGGSLILSAPTNDFASTGTVEGGKLQIDGGFTNAVLTVNNGSIIANGQIKNVTVAAGGSLSGSGTINTATVAGALSGTIGAPLTMNNLTLTPTANINLIVPSDATVAGAPAFQGNNIALNGTISSIQLPHLYAVNYVGASFYMFNYLSSTGSISISDAVKEQYADSNFTFGGIQYGYLVLNSKMPAPTPTVQTANLANIPNPSLWSGTKNTFVDGSGWTIGSALFSGNGAQTPIQMEGRVQVAGLTIIGGGFQFVDSGNRAAPAVFTLTAAGGETSVPLTVTTGNAATIAVPVGGTSNFSANGGGRLVFTGNSADYTGTGSIAAGETYVLGNMPQTNFEVGSAGDGAQASLRVNGQANIVNVNRTGTLDGLSSGGLSNVNIRTLNVLGGTLKPGNSPGTIRLGDYTQKGGFLELEPGDRIQVVTAPASGTLSATGGRAVFAPALDGTPVQVTLTNSEAYQYGTPYAFVVAENGVTLTSPSAVTVSAVRTDGTADNRLFMRFAFDVFDTEGSFAQTSAVRTVGAVYMVRNPARNFASVALTRNQLAVATALDARARDGRSSGGPLFNALMSARTDQINDVRMAIGQLSGEIHASTQGVLIEESRYLREATLNRTRASLGKRQAASEQGVQQLQSADVALWGQAFGSWGRNDRTSQAAALDRSVGGFVLGADTGFGTGNWRLGFAGGYSQSKIDAKSLPSEAQADNYHLALYAGTRFDNIGPGSVGLRFGLGNTWHRLDTTRQLNAMGLQDTAQAKYDARTFQIYGEAGYEVSFTALTVEPYANLAYVNNHTDGFTERSLTGLAGLTGASRTDGTGFSTLGVRLSTEVTMGTSKATLRGGLGWRHAFGDVTPDARFSSAALGAFSVSGSPIAKNALAIEAGVEAKIAEGTSLGVSYNGQLASDAQDHGVRGYLAVRF